MTDAFLTPLMDPITTVEALEDRLSDPTPALLEAAKAWSGDLIVLGAGGKMGPTLARMARRAMTAAGVSGKVIAVSRYSDPVQRERIEAAGIETISGDLLDPSFVAGLPEAARVVFMAGMKFGSTGAQSLTWAMNALLPANVCRRYAGVPIAAFSTGNIYGMSPVRLGGSLESDEPNPQGEYAMSCLGRERVFEHHSRTDGTPVTLVRLNYACELRYGVLVDLAQKIWDGKPVDLTMGMANVIWQRDANAMALLALDFAATPARALNVAGPEQVSVRRVCQRLAAELGREASFTGEEGPDAILSNGQLGHRLYGYPTVTMDEMISLVADWTRRGGERLGKPTKFEVRDGKF